MSRRKVFFKGIHYRNRLVYNIFTFLKLRTAYTVRYKIAARYIEAGSSVLDVCSGSGELKEFLPSGCTYTGIDASPEFIANLSKKSVPHRHMNLHNGISPATFQADIVVMIISLAQFRHTSVDTLLEDFKKIAKRVIIIEDVVAKQTKIHTFIRPIMNYVSATDYYVPGELFTMNEFEHLMRAHHYQCIKEGNRYYVGYYDTGEQRR